MSTIDHAWLPRTSCSERCIASGLGVMGHRALRALRGFRRITSAALILAALPALVVPLPGHRRVKRYYCRMLLRSLGVRIALSGGPVRNLQGMLVVSNHVSWTDAFAIGALLPGKFVARADLIDWPAVGAIARLAKVVPIERRSLRTLPGVIDTVAEYLRGGHTVIAFPEGTTFCGRDSGRFRPALFQSAIDAGRPVQPLRLSYRHRDGDHSTVTAFLGEDSVWESVKRIACAGAVTVEVDVLPLELPGGERRELAARCEVAVNAQPAFSTHPQAQLSVNQAGAAQRHGEQDY